MKSAKRILSALMVCVLAMALCVCAPASADEGRNEWNGIVWEQDSLLGALFIRGIGSMPVDIPMPWADSASENTSVSFDDGVTDIPTGFTAGCVNMKTIMIPASLRTIGQGVLTVSGGLRDVYYQGTLAGLLSIQMFPEDRAALNGAIFHGSKIVYKEDGEFEYVPIEDGESGEINIQQNGNTITGKLSDGTTYTIVLGEDGLRESAQISTSESDISITYHYREDGTLEWRSYRSTNKETGKTGTIVEYYASDGKTRTKDTFTSDDSTSVLTKAYYPDGKTVKERTLETNDLGKRVDTYREDGSLQSTVTTHEGSEHTINYSESGAKTDEVYNYSDGGKQTYTYSGEKGSEKLVEKRTDYPSGNVEIIEYSEGETVTKEYRNGKIYKVVDDIQGKRKDTYSYGDDAVLDQIVSEYPDGHVTTYEYESNGKIKHRQTNYPDGRTVSYEYTNGQMVKQVEIRPDEVKTTVDYTTSVLTVEYSPNSLHSYVKKEMATEEYKFLENKNYVVFTDGSYVVETISDTSTTGMVYDSNDNLIGQYTATTTGNTTIADVTMNGTSYKVTRTQNTDGTYLVTTEYKDGLSVQEHYTETLKLIDSSMSPMIF